MAKNKAKNAKQGGTVSAAPPEENAGKCCWCARPASTCWVMPCLELEEALRKEDDTAMALWAEGAGIKLAKRGKPLSC